MRNILPKNLKRILEQPILLPLIISAISITLEFGVPSTWTGIVIVLTFATITIWIADRLYNAYIRGQVEVKGAWTALGLAILIVIITWLFGYLAMLYPAWETVFIILWFILVVLFLKFLFFGDEDLERRAWTQAIVFAFILGVVSVIALYIAAWVTLFLEYIGLSQYIATIVTSLIFVVILLILLFADRKRMHELPETLREAGRDLVTPSEWVGKGWGR